MSAAEALAAAPQYRVALAVRPGELELLTAYSASFLSDTPQLDAPCGLTYLIQNELTQVYLSGTGEYLLAMCAYVNVLQTAPQPPAPQPTTFAVIAAPDELEALACAVSGRHRIRTPPERRNNGPEIASLLRESRPFSLGTHRVYLDGVALAQVVSSVAPIVLAGQKEPPVAPPKVEPEPRRELAAQYNATLGVGLSVQQESQARLERCERAERRLNRLWKRVSGLKMDVAGVSDDTFDDLRRALPKHRLPKALKRRT